MAYKSMLNFEECVGVFNYWIQDKLKATSNLVVKNINGDKAKASFKVNNEDCDAIIRLNYNELGYCDAVLFPYYKGHADPVHIKRAVEHAGGEAYASNEWMQLSYARWKDTQGNSGNSSKKAHKLSKAKPENFQRSQEELDRLQFDSDKADYFERLPGAAVAQYLYKLAQAQQDTNYHFSQVIKTPNQHPYNKRKAFTDPEHFYIIPNVKPTKAQIIKFLNSDKFQMPRNPYGFQAQDILNQINDPEIKFDIDDYISNKDIQLGVGIMPSMDLDGVVTNVQKYLVQNLPNGTDKIFLKGALVRDSYYIFNHEQKLRDDYKPKNVVILEGWATGKTNNECFNEKNNDTLVVVAWNAGQMKNAVLNCGQRYPDANIIIGADNDVKSFIKSNEKEIDELHLVKNTGIQCAIEACHHNPELSSRISVLLPNIQFQNYITAKCPSDMNDIEAMYGMQAVKANLVAEINAAAQRRKEGVSEIPRLVDLYNTQMKYFSELHNIPLHGIQPSGQLDTEPYVPVKLAENRKNIELRAEQESDNLINQMVESPTTGFFDVEVNNDIKSDFDKKMEESARVLVHVENQQNPTPENVVANTLAPTVEAPADQPIIDPVTFTAVLYQSHLMNSFSQLQELEDKSEMLSALENSAMTMDSANKMVQAMFDPTISPHIPAMLGKAMESYRDQSIYNDLSEIKSIMDEDYLRLTGETMKFMQDTQRDMVNTFVCSHQHQGLDEEVAHKLVHAEIYEQPIEMKRVFFTELRDSLSNLGASDDEWIQKLKDTLLETKQHSAVLSKVKAVDAEYSPSL